MAYRCRGLLVVNWNSSLGPWYSTCLDRNFPAVAVAAVAAVAVVSAVAAAELYVVLLPVER